MASTVRILRDWSDTSLVDRYFDTCTPSSLAPSTRSLLGQRCSRLRWSRDCSGAFSSQLDPSVPETQNDTAGLRAVAPLDTLSSTSSLPTSRVMGFRTRSRTPRPIKGPLVPVEPRGDGNVARLLCAPVSPSIAAVPDVVRKMFPLEKMSCAGYFFKIDLICSIQSDSRNGTTPSLQVSNRHHERRNARCCTYTWMPGQHQAAHGRRRVHRTREQTART